jgi:putative hydrolase of the HAD superfamily
MIFFDIDGTLVDHKGAERAAALAFQRDHANVFPGSPDAFAARWHEVAERHIRRHFSGELTFQEQRRARLRELFAHDRQLTDSKADELFQAYLRRYEENWRLYRDAIPCLEQFANHALGIISNGKSSQQRKKLAQLGIAQRFRAVIVSGDVGVAKPALGIFVAACTAVGRQPSECVYVGDDLMSDAQGSKRAGLHAIWLNRHGPEKATAVVTVASLQDLGELIESHNNEVHWISESRAAASFRNE